MTAHVPRMIPKGRIDSFLESLGVPVAVPVALNGTGDIDFRIMEKPVAATAACAESYVNSAISPLKFAYPQTQVLWRFHTKPEIEVIPPAAPRELAIFGIRSCDVSAFRYLEHFFAREPKDDLFAATAAKILLISVTCQEPDENCFCVCCDGGPFLDRKFDVQLTDLGDSYLFEIGSAKGEAAAATGERFLEPAPDGAIRKKEELHEATLRKFVVTSHMATGIRKLTARKVPDALWRRMAARCSECGGCAFVCPMCTCFDVSDQRETADSGRRERCWDCCQYSGYSREASGYNPRDEKVSRFKRRFTHKLSYYYVQADGVHGCVGCGRCIQACFGKVDMPGVVNALRTETIV